LKQKRYEEILEEIMDILGGAEFPGFVPVCVVKAYKLAEKSLLEVRKKKKK